MRIKDARTGQQAPAPEGQLADTEELDAVDEAEADEPEVEVLDELPEPEAPPGPAAPAEASEPPEAPEADTPHESLLFDARGYEERWTSIQLGFVDEPLYAVESAGRLLAEVLGEVASTFASKRKDLESQWRHTDEVSTEDLRLAFRGYRTFFQRVIAL